MFTPPGNGLRFRGFLCVTVNHHAPGRRVQHQNLLYQLVYDTEGFIYRSFSNLSGRAEKPITGGVVGRGNQYMAGAPHLELTASAQPTQTLYLRGFDGGEYIGGELGPLQR